MLLAFLQSNGQGTTAIADFRNFSQTTANFTTFNAGDNSPHDILEYINRQKSISTKYDTVRVLIAYADTGSIKIGFGSDWGEAIYHDYQNRILKWEFVYSVRKKVGNSTPFNENGFFGDAPYYQHIKYLTEDKKSIPSSWVVLIEKSL